MCDRVRNPGMEQGNAWVWKPTGPSADGRVSFTWGGDVLVTEGGGEPLFQPANGLVALD